MTMKVKSRHEAASRAIADGSLPAGDPDPTFTAAKANIEMFPVMDRADLEKGLQQVSRRPSRALPYRATSTRDAAESSPPSARQGRARGCGDVGATLAAPHFTGLREMGASGARFF